MNGLQYIAMFCAVSTGVSKDASLNLAADAPRA
jgi:hypothetical protein